MKEWSTAWAFLSTISALSIGWGLSQASAWLTVRQADKRVLKEVLYFLLELRHQLSSIERLKQASHLYVVAVLGEEAEALPAEVHAELAGAFRPVLRTIIAPILVERLAGIKEGYQACLLKLAAVDPLNANLLRGHDLLPVNQARVK